MSWLSRGLHRLARGAALWRHGIVPELYPGRMAAFETLAPEEQDRRSLALLRELLVYAGSRVPYYRDAFGAAGVDPRGLREPADLAAFPVLDKRQLVEQRERLTAPGRALRGAQWDATGGSTGDPVRFLRSREFIAWSFANELRMWRWYGAEPGAPWALVWGADRDLPPERSVKSLRGRLLGVCQLNAFFIDEERCRVFAGLLEDFRPAVVYGYATALARFAAWARDSGRELGIRPKAIRSTAEVLLPDHRELIERHLHGPVYDYLGGRDAGPVAGECREHRGLHVFPDVTWVEVVRPDGTHCAAGEVGEILVTKLRERAMPFVRYRTGDRASWLHGTCGCGLAFPRLTSVEGRVGDFVRAPDGREIHGEFFTHLFYGVPGVARFQVRQPAPDRLRILVQPAGEPDPSTLERIRRASADHFGARDPADVAIEIVDQIPVGASGKHRFVLPYPAAAESADA